MSHSDTAELARVFADHRARVSRALRRAGVPERDVPDAQQDVFIVVQRKLTGFEGRAAIGSWLHGIAVRVASQYRRSARARYERMTEGEPRDPLQAAIAHERCALRRLDDAALRVELEAALLALSAPQREVFLRHELHELSMHEVATQLDIPLKTAFSRLYAARRALAESLRAAGAQVDDSRGSRLRGAAWLWIGFGFSWASLHATRVARAQAIATPKLAIAAISVVGALALQAAPRRSQAPQGVEVHAPLARGAVARHEPRAVVTNELVVAAPAAMRRARPHRKHALAPPLTHEIEDAPIEIATPHVEPGPVPGLDYAVYRSSAYDLRPAVDRPLTAQTSSTRLAPRIRLRGPSDPVSGIEIAFAID